MISYLYYNIVLGSSILPLLILGFQNFKKTYKNDKFKTVFTILLMVRFLTDVGSFVLEKTIKNSFPIFHFAIPIMFILILDLFYLIGEFKNFKKYLIIFGLLFFGLDLTITANLFCNNHFSTLYAYLIISILGWMFLLKNKGTHFQRQVLISITLYYTPLTLYSYFENEIYSSKALSDLLLNFFVSFNLILNLLFTRALWLNRRT